MSSIRSGPQEVERLVTVTLYVWDGDEQEVGHCLLPSPSTNAGTYFDRLPHFLGYRESLVSCPVFFVRGRTHRPMGNRTDSDPWDLFV